MPDSSDFTGTDKLPAETARVTYALDVGQDTLEMHEEHLPSTKENRK